MNFSDLTSSIPFFGPMHTLMNLSQAHEQPSTVSKGEEKKAQRIETEHKTKDVVSERVTNCYVPAPEGEKEAYMVKISKLPFNDGREKEIEKEGFDERNILKKGLPDSRQPTNYQKLIQDVLNKDGQQIQKMSQSDLENLQHILGKSRQEDQFISKQTVNQCIKKQNKVSFQSLSNSLSENDIFKVFRLAIVAGLIENTDIIQAANDLGMQGTSIYKLD